MALKRWSLDRLLAWVGTTALIVLFVPMGLYLTRDVSSAAERSLSERGESLLKTLAAEIVEPLLLKNQLALHYALQKASSTTYAEVRYLCIENAQGTVVSHTFAGGFPLALKKLWEKNRRVVRFRTKGESLLDISEPVLAGQLGTLHLGMSRVQAAKATARVLWLMGPALAASLSIIMIGARIVATRVSNPLRLLEKHVSAFPQQAFAGDGPGPCGTREVESLVRGFADMARRLNSLERERVTTQQRMIQAERLAALGELAAGLAHEIHNPLDGMLECLRYLDADLEKSDRAGKYYPMLRDGLDRIAMVMREMLTLARSGRKVTFEPYHVEEMLEALGLLIAPHMEDKKVRLTWRRPGTCCVCLCDRQGLAQAALNLALNAAEAAEESPDPEVRMEADCDSRWVYICVEDSGPGVPQELRERIFQPFFTTKPFGKGTGLGLSVSRQLIRAAGGELELSPEAGSLGGARFVIKLPKVLPSEDAHGRGASEDSNR